MKMWTDLEFENAVIQAWTGIIATNGATDPIRTAQKAITLATELETALEVELGRRHTEEKSTATS